MKKRKFGLLLSVSLVAIIAMGCGEPDFNAIDTPTDYNDQK